MRVKGFINVLRNRVQGGSGWVTFNKYYQIINRRVPFLCKWVFLSLFIGWRAG